MFETFVDLLAFQEQHHPQDRVSRFLVDGEVHGAADELTYSGLARRARAIAGELQERGYGGQRALLLYPPGLEFVGGFFGCLFASVTAVPVPVPQFHELDRALRRLNQVIADADIHVVLSTRMVVDALAAVSAQIPE
jgi:acyl-CoA synthetase (AMP-forming)/AMP-acid ligase II